MIYRWFPTLRLSIENCRTCVTSEHYVSIIGEVNNFLCFFGNTTRKRNSRQLSRNSALENHNTLEMISLLHISRGKITAVNAEKAQEKRGERSIGLRDCRVDPRPRETSEKLSVSGPL